MTRKKRIVDTPLYRTTGYVGRGDRLKLNEQVLHRNLKIEMRSPPLLERSTHAENGQSGDGYRAES